MRELILTHVNAMGTAIIVLVDYQAYTAKVKIIQFTDDYMKHPEIKSLIESGKLRVYRERIFTTADAWLATDPERGCLLVTAAGEVKHISFKEYMGEVLDIDTKQYIYYNNSQNPVHFGHSQQSESFWETLCGVMEKYNKPLKDTDVLTEVFRLTGVQIYYLYSGCVGGDAQTEAYSESYRISLAGCFIDKFCVDSKGQNLEIHVIGGEVGEIQADCMSKANICVLSGSINSVKVGRNMLSLRFDSNKARIYTEATDCSLNSIEGYAYPHADLTAFKKLSTYNYCWNVEEKNTPIYVSLPEVDNYSFEYCFVNVDFKQLYPFLDNGGNFILKNIGLIRRSFRNFNGIKTITGEAREIADSFVSLSFNGSFDIRADRCASSFCYLNERYNVYSPKKDQNISAIESGTAHGVIRIYATPVREPFRGYTQYIEASLGEDTHGGQRCAYHWKQTQTLIYDKDTDIDKLTINPSENVTYEINQRIHKCLINCGYPYIKRGEIVFNKTVDFLMRGNYPYAKVVSYGDRCFECAVFENMHVCALEEGSLKYIGNMAFHRTKGINYLVIPRSCISIGRAAFSEMKNCSGGLATICVYRDSFAHNWVKGKNVNHIVIDSLGDIPKEAPLESEMDFIAAFVDTPTWANKSKPFVAKLLSASEVDLRESIESIGVLSDEVLAFFKKQRRISSGINLDSVREKGSEYSFVDEKDDSVLGENRISRSLLNAVALNSVYGSRLDLLDINILKQFIWVPLDVYDVTRWHGVPRFMSAHDVIGDINIYLRGKEIYYVGCGSITLQKYNCMQKQGYLVDKTVRCIPWDTPCKAPSSDCLFAPQVVNRLRFENAWGGSGNELRCYVLGEELKGEVKEKINELMLGSFVSMLRLEFAKSGRGIVNDEYLYDIVNKKIYKFSSVCEQYSPNTLGTYCGEISIANFVAEYGERIRCVKECEDMYKNLAAFKAPSIKKASPCFEAEFCRTNRPFNLKGAEPNTMLFIEFLTKSGLVKSIAKSNFNSRAQNPSLVRLSDGTELSQSLSPSGCTRLLGIQLSGGKFYGFEAAFDMIDFSDMTDRFINGIAEYQKPERGYLEYANTLDLIEVSPRKEGNVSCLVFAIDLLSGKLVLVKRCGSTAYVRSCICCSFDSGQDARSFMTEYGCLFHSYPTGVNIKPLCDSVVIKNDRVVVADREERASIRIKNSLRALGSVPNTRKLDEKNEIYDLTILKYCRG